MTLAGLFAAWICAGTLPSPEIAGDRPLEVTAATCPGLDATEIERLVALELRSVTQAIRDGPPLAVELVCSDRALRIDVTDPLTHKALSRTLPPVPHEVGQERVIALAIAQLFAASWLELLLAAEDEPTPNEPPEIGAPNAATRAALELAEGKLDQRPPTKPQRVELVAGLGVRGRALERAPFAAAHVDLEIRGWLTPRAGLVGRVGFDYGQANRDAGQVRALAALVGGGLGWRVRPRDAVGVGGSVVLSGGIARLAGRPARDGVQSSSTTSGTGEALASIGPRIFGAKLRVDLDAEIGGMLRAPVGLVQNGEQVSIGGVFAGVSLRLGGVVSRASTTRN